MFVHLNCKTSFPLFLEFLYTPSDVDFGIPALELTEQAELLFDSTRPTGIPDAKL
jgi:hypothetical protein